MDILQIISQWWLIAVWWLAVILWYKFFSKKIDNISVRDPKDHKFFSEIDFYIHNKIPNIKLYSKEFKYEPWRTAIFRDMLISKLKIWRDFVFIFATNDSPNILDCSTKCINWLVDWYNGDREEKQIPKIVIDKFNYRHIDHANTLMNWIESICGSRSFHNDFEKKNAILHLHIMMLVVTVIDAEKTLWVLNWELTGVKYKWIIL